MKARNFKGANYDANKTVKEIAKEVRAYIRKTHKDCKFSVTSDRNCLSIQLIKSVEEVRLPLNKDRISKFTEYGQNLYDSVFNFAESFNYDKSEIMTDYFDVNFYLRVQL